MRSLFQKKRGKDEPKPVNTKVVNYDIGGILYFMRNRFGCVGSKRLYGRD